MFFKTTVSEISNTNPLFNFRNNSTTEYVFNARYLSNILNNNGGSSFVLINDYDRRGRDIYFESSTSVVDIIDEMDSPSANGYYTLNYFKNDNPAKAVLNRDIPIDHIIALFAYWNPSYTWLVFDSYNDYRRVLINDTLDDIFTELTTATTTLATTTLITTTVATTTPIPTTTGVTTTAGPTTTFAGTTYYVSNTGSDSADGLTPATAWQTVAKVNASTFDPDTQILFKCGDTWRETLEVPSAGTSGQYLYFGNYGTGSNPRILGSKATTTWADQGSNIWKTDITFVNPRSLYPNYADIVFNVGGAERFGVYQANTASLNTEFEWTWSSNYIYIYSTSDPATAYTGIEVPQRRFCVSTNDNSYVQFDGIDAAYSADVGYDSNNDHTVSDQHGCIIENCEIKYIGGITGAQYGFGIAIAYSNLTVRNNEIHHIGRRGISINMEYTASPYTVHDVLIENNIFHHGSHTTAFDMTINNGGNSASIDGVVFRNNYVYEADGVAVGYPVNQIWLQSYAGNGTMDNVYIYNNIFKYWRDNSVAMETRKIYDVFLYNNTFYENNSEGGYYGTSYCVNADTDSNNTLRLHAKNNIFYTTFPNDTSGNGSCIVMYLVNEANQDVDYNLYYRINNTVRIMLINGASYYMNTAFPTPEGYETNGIKDNPDFVVGSAYHLQATSPAIAQGLHTGTVVYDYDGDARNNPPCIGADEYDPADTTIAPTTTSAGTTTAAGTTTPAGTTTYHTTTSTSTTTSNLESYSDDFSAYSTGDLAGQGDWLTCLNQIIVTATARVQANSSGNDNCVKLSLPFSNDHYAQITNVQMAAGGGTMGVAARCSGSGATATYYVFEYTNTNGYFGKVVNGSYTTLAESTRNGLANDVLKIAVEGTSIKLYLNGSLDTTFGSGQNGCTGNQGSYTDSSISTGVPGIAGWSNLTTQGDNFEASDIA